MNLLFSLLLTASSAINPEVLQNLSELEKASPNKALIEYNKQKHNYKHTFSENALQFHRIAIKAAIDQYDWDTFLGILSTLKNKEFELITRKKAHHIINDIGVAYRQNNQYKDAIEHFTCALNKTSNGNYIAALKANIATAYRVQGQPAVGFQLLNSIEHKVLDKNISAGIYNLRGNLALYLGEIDQAIKYIEKARTLFISQNKVRFASRLRFSLMTAALIKRDVSLYQVYRKNIEADLMKLAIDNHDFLRFLDEVNHAILIEDIPSLMSQHITDLIKLLERNDDANRNVRLLLKSLNLETLISQEQEPQPKEPLLPSNLASNWCAGMK